MLAIGIPDEIRPSPIVTLPFYAKSDLLRAAERQEAIPIETTRGLAARCHFKGKTAGHSPRRSLSALLADELGLRPIFIRKPSGSTTFKLDKVSEHLLDQWMEDNLCVALQPYDNPDDYERELIRRWEPPLNCDKKVCLLNAQQSFVLDRREMFKANAARLAGNG